MTHYIHIPNQFVTTADGVQIAYRDYGNLKKSFFGVFRY